jgi:hypothetical protein
LQDNALIALLINVIIAGESAANIAGTPVKQAFQPTSQGANSIPTAYLYKIGDQRIGYVARRDCWDKPGGVMMHTETQQYATTFQISALAQQNPTTPTQYTASDILNLVASILQSSVTIAALEAQNVGILHIGEVRNPYFQDDYQRNEASPSMDVVLTHRQVIVTQTPIVNEYEYQILEV